MRRELSELQEDHTTRGVGNFRLKLLLATALIASGITFIGVLITERHLALRSERELQALIDRETQGAMHARLVRQAVLQDICERLAQQPRIHAALEDDALDLLYPSARNDLHRLLVKEEDPEGSTGLEAIFYRFLDHRGKLIPPAAGDGAGSLPEALESQLEPGRLLLRPQKGYFALPANSAPGSHGEWVVAEVFATPVVSTVTFEPIAVLLVGFPFVTGQGKGGFQGVTGVIWDATDAHPEPGVWALPASGSGAVRPPRLNEEQFTWLEGWIRPRVDPEGGDWTVRPPQSDSPWRVIVRPLNEESAYPLAYLVFAASLSELDERLVRSRTQIIGAGAILFFLGLLLSHWIASRFSKPVRALAEVSERERFERERAETKLEATAEELRRQARFSADASHQLKTPVSVMRVGLEELLNYGDLSLAQREEVIALIGQTDRLTRVIDDL